MSSSPVAVLLLLILCICAGHCQLTGAHTIDNSLPTGGANFSSFVAAASSLASNGVAGPVTFTVFPGSGPYAGFSLAPFAGMGSSNPVTFVAASGPRPVIGTAATGFAQGIRLGTATSQSSAIGTGVTHITLVGLEIANVASGAGIMDVGGQFNTIQDCVVHNCGSGVYLLATQDSVIEGCEAYNNAQAPGSPGTSSYCGEFTAFYLSARNCIVRNRAHDSNSNGVFVGSSSSSTTTTDHLVVNNMIWNVGTQFNNTHAGGLTVVRAPGAVIANNSISMPPGSNKPGLHIKTHSTTLPLVPALVANNLVQVQHGATSCIQIDFPSNAPAVLRNNVYDAAGGGPVGGSGITITTPTHYATLLDWATVTGAETASLAAPAGFLSATDLHISSSAAAFNSGTPILGVVSDIDQDPRPAAGIMDVGADEAPAPGLFASFTASPLTGSTPLIVNFTDTSFSSDPGGVLTWNWDLDGDGLTDSTVQNPSHTYLCQGSYAITLTVTDASNPSSTKSIANYITVTGHSFSMTTTGGGVGDLSLTPVPAACYPTTAFGYTLISLSTGAPVGTGPLFGIAPDAVTFIGLNSIFQPGNPLAFIPDGVSYPDSGTIMFGAGFFSALAGNSMDACQVMLDNSWTITHQSAVVRVTF